MKNPKNPTKSTPSFGMLLPKRHGSVDSYRYGFQGQEKDDEIKGEGNSINFTFRMYDPRIGRFGSIDPLTAKYPHYTPYSFSGNKVIAFTEFEGMEEEFKISGYMAMEEASKPGLSQAESREVYKSTLKSLRFLGNADIDYHMMLDGLGFVPLFGEAFDGINAATYVYEGDYLNAAFSTISIAPLAGDFAAKGFKYSLKAAGYEAKMFKTLGAAQIWVKNAMEYGFKSADAISKRSTLKSILKITKKGMQAHHIIPIELIGKSEVVQKAIDAGFDFNGAVNGIAVKALKEGGEHANHPSYTKGVLGKINEWVAEHPDYTGKQAKEFLNTQSGKLKDKIQKESVEGGKKINDLIIN